MPLARSSIITASILALGMSAACQSKPSESPSSSPFTAETWAKAIELRNVSSQGSDAYAIVESLTTEIGPRLAGSTEYDRATAWAQAKFQALGYDKVYLEPVVSPVWQRHHERAEVLSPYPQKLAITALGGSIGTGRTPIEAEVIEFSTLEALIAAPADSLKGKIAYIAYRMERFRDGHGYGPARAARSNGAIEAAKKGASAVIIRSIGTDSDRLPHTGAMQYDGAIPKIPAAALSNPDADLLSNMIRRGKPVKLRLDIDAGPTGNNKTEYNVIGEIRGRELPEEIVAIGGHLDSWDLGTGAIDDGAGVAITMAAGALIGKLEQAPRRTIRVIAFANEEQGLFGGKAYAEAHRPELHAHQLIAESDFGAGRIYAFAANVDARAQPTIERIAHALAPLGITYEKNTANIEPGPDFIPLMEQDEGIPSAQLSQDGTDYFDWHHTANDTLDKIDPKALDQQVAAYAVLAYLAAEAEADFGKSSKPSYPDHHNQDHHNQDHN